MESLFAEYPALRVPVTLAALTLLWAAMWHFGLRHVPLLANLKGVIVGDGKPSPGSQPPKRQKMVFRGANGLAGQSSTGPRRRRDDTPPTPPS